MSTKRQAFVVEARLTGDTGLRRPHIVAHCRLCEREEAIPISSQCGSVPAEFGQKLFRRRGWKMGANRTKDECPRCKAGAQIASAPEADRPILKTLAVLRDIRHQDDVPEEVQLPETKKAKARVFHEAAPKPEEMTTAMGAALAEAVQQKTPAKAKTAPLSKAEQPAPAVEPKAEEASKDRGKGVRGYWASMSPEERSERQRLAAATRKAKKETAEQERRRKMTAHLSDAHRQWRESLTPEQREAWRQSILAGRTRRNAQQTEAAEAAAEEHEPMAQAKLSEVTTLPAAARQPTREQNRSIHDALDEHYDVDKGCYRGSMSDRQLADKLDFPAVWIAAIREGFFGPDRCEASDALRREIDQIKRKQDDLQTEFLKAMETFDNRSKQLSDALQRACAKAGIPVV